MFLKKENIDSNHNNIKKETIYYTSSNNKNKIYSTFWIPKNPKMLFQIAHGMVEHIERYDNFANFLNQYGIVVFGNDHLGHGNSINSQNDFGYFSEENGNEHIISDMYLLTKIAKEKFPNLPFTFLGHSMGSYLLRAYLFKYGNEIDNAIIMGTGDVSPFLLKLGINLTEKIAEKKGWFYRSNIINNLAFGGFNKKFGKKDGKEWLSRDANEVLKYNNDYKCNFIFTLNAYNNLFKIIYSLSDDKNLEKIPKNLNILFLAGKDDPVGNFGKGVLNVYKKFQSLGLKSVECKLYNEYRHEILNELEKEIVYNDIINWLQK